MRFRSFVLATGVSCAVGAAASADAVPHGWIFTGPGDNPGDYALAIDRSGKEAVAVLSAKVEKPKRHGTLMQIIVADKYRGKRIRFRAQLRPKNLATPSGLWVRVDGPEFEKPVAWSNMGDKQVRGTADWSEGSVVLDVPKEGEKIFFGVAINGAGELAAKSLVFEIVDKSVPLTLPHGWQAPAAEPQNLELKE